jgi:predicted phosphodiesterase
MARRAVISDIHGNLVALEAVLADIKRQNVDDIVNLGDVCGYGPQPIECIKLVREHCKWTLLGNHDEALFVEPKDFGANAKQSIEWQRTILEPGPNSTPEDRERWEWLKSLKPIVKEKDIEYVHASPRDPIYEYVLRDDFHDEGLGPTPKAKEIFAAMDWLAFCGHSHRPGVVAEDYKWWRPSELENASAVIKKGFKTLVNVGSVGQPRDGIPDACYVILEYTPPNLAPAPAAAAHNTTTKIVASASSSTMIKTKSEMENGKPNGNGNGNGHGTSSSSPTPAPSAPPMPDAQEETRYGQDLKHVRDTALLMFPKVHFRRVEYDIGEAQKRFKAVPMLPDNNWLRLSKGV